MKGSLFLGWTVPSILHQPVDFSHALLMPSFELHQHGSINLATGQGLNEIACKGGFRFWSLNIQLQGTPFTAQVFEYQAVLQDLYLDLLRYI